MTPTPAEMLSDDALQAIRQRNAEWMSGAPCDPIAYATGALSDRNDLLRHIDALRRPQPIAGDAWEAEVLRLHTAVIDALRYVFKDIPDDAEMLRRMEALGAAERAFTAAVARPPREGDEAVIERMAQGMWDAEDQVFAWGPQERRRVKWTQAIELNLAGVEIFRKFARAALDAMRGGKGC